MLKLDSLIVSGNHILIDKFFKSFFEIAHDEKLSVWYIFKCFVVHFFWRKKGCHIEPAVYQHSVQTFWGLRVTSHLLKGGLWLLKVLQSFTEVVFIFANAGQIAIENDSKFIIRVYKWFSLHKPLLRSLNKTLLSIPHGNRIHNFKHLFFLVHTDNSAFLFSSNQRVIFFWEFLDLSFKFWPFSHHPIFIHNLY